MGQAKRQMEEQEETLNSVLGRLAEAGAVSECENHGYMVDNGDSAAVEQVKSDLAEELGEDEADKVVEEALQQVGDECPGCAKNAMDD